MYTKWYLLFVSVVHTGIGNSSETDYVRGFTHYARQNGHRVAVFNHVGALKDEKLTGGRMFTYGKWCKLIMCREPYCVYMTRDGCY